MKEMVDLLHEAIESRKNKSILNEDSIIRVQRRNKREITSKVT